MCRNTSGSQELNKLLARFTNQHEDKFPSSSATKHDELVHGGHYWWRHHCRAVRGEALAVLTANSCCSVSPGGGDDDDDEELRSPSMNNRSAPAVSMSLLMSDAFSFFFFFSFLFYRWDEGDVIKLKLHHRVQKTNMQMRIIRESFWLSYVQTD